MPSIEISQLAAALANAVEGTEELDRDPAVTAEPRLLQWIDRCLRIARSPLEGIEDPARDLSEFAFGDREVMEQARRVILEALSLRPGHPVLQQMSSLWRRAFEKGAWAWEPPPGAAERYL